MSAGDLESNVLSPQGKSISRLADKVVPISASAVMSTVYLCGIFFFILKCVAQFDEWF